MRKIRYKEPTDALSKMAAPKDFTESRASIGMDKFTGEYFYLSLEKLIPFKNQARVHFDQKELEQLADTIKEHGVRQPLSVIKSDVQEGKYEIISGERRFRASKIAGLTKVPCIILEHSAQKDEIALIENIQRTDLHPIELARGLKKLIDNYGWGGQTEIEKRLGIPTSRISESLKLLSLSEEIQNLIIEKNFTGRENLLGLLKLEDDEARAKKISGKPLGVKTAPPSSFSVLRVTYADHDWRIQKNSIKKLDKEQKQDLKNLLLDIIQELN